MGNQSENVDDEEQDGSGEDGSSSEEIEDILQRQCASMCEDESSGEEIEDIQRKCALTKCHYYCHRTWS